MFKINYFIYQSRLSSVFHTFDNNLAVQHADDGYSRRGNFGGSLVHSIFSMCSPDGTNVYGSRGGKFEGIGSV